MTAHKTHLEDYFDFLDDDDIRIKGTRVDIETVLDDYFNASSFAADKAWLDQATRNNFYAL